jgi:CBS domain-containing protein
MRDKEIGFCPVCDDSGRVVGTLTDRDLTIRVLAERRRPEETCAGDVMSRGVVACRPTDDLLIAERLMSEHKVSRMLCVDESGKPVGVISLSDIATVNRGVLTAEVMRSVSEREVRGAQV